jgi:hypothetical protein
LTVEAAEPTGEKPPVPEPARRPPADDGVAEQPPELQEEMAKVDGGEASSEQEQLEDWPLPAPSTVKQGSPQHGDQDDRPLPGN